MFEGLSPADARAAFHAMCDDPDTDPETALAAFEELCAIEAREREATQARLDGRWDTVFRISEILADIDPVHIVTDANPDEYDGEAEDITLGLDGCRSPSDITDLTVRVFEDWLWAPAPGDPADYARIATRIWDLLA